MTLSENWLITDGNFPTVACLPTYQPSFQQTGQTTFLSFCQPTYLPTIPTYKPAKHPSYLPAGLSTYLYYLWTDLPNLRFIYMSACLHTCTTYGQNAKRPSYLPVNLPTYLK